MIETKYDISFFKNVAKEKSGECLSEKYEGYTTKLVFKCSNGHLFEKTPGKIIQNKWCQECSRKNRIKYTIDDFCKIANGKNGKCLSKEYKSWNDKLVFECEHGHKFSMIPSGIICGKWCSKCHFNNVRKYSIDDFKDIAKKHGGECLSNEYVSRDEKLKFKCSCGRVWNMLPQSLIIGSWCEVCAKKSKLDIDHFIKLANEHNGKCLSKSFSNLREKLKFECEKGHQWETAAKNIQYGCWCPKCKIQSLTLYTLDHNFFEQETENSFYWAGFFFADGCVRKVKNQFIISLKLAAKDKGHLLKFKDAIKSNHPLHYEPPKIHTFNNQEIKSSGSFVLRVSSEKMFKDLEKFGIIPNKTYIADIPDYIKNHKLANHFWRGWADGDGSFAIGDKSVVFTGVGNKKALKSFHEILLINGISVHIDKTIGSNNNSEIIGNMSYGGNINMCKLYDFLYSNSNIFLERKEKTAKMAKYLISKKNYNLLYGIS